MPKETQDSNGVAFYNPEDEDLSEADPIQAAATSPPRPLTLNMAKNDTVEQLRKCTLRQVDSEIFDDDGSFSRYAQSPSGSNHAVSQPFEMSGELSNRARLESSMNEGTLSPRSTNGILLEDETPRAKSPQLIEMHTFRDAIDVNYQRMAITGEELSGVPLEDHNVASKELIKALEIARNICGALATSSPPPYPIS
ncbi:unnamed protein product, partial [Mesorhabditis spiculigera]